MEIEGLSRCLTGKYYITPELTSSSEPLVDDQSPRGAPSSPIRDTSYIEKD